MSQSTEERIQQELATERLRRALNASLEVMGLSNAYMSPERKTIVLAALIIAYKE